MGEIICSVDGGNCCKQRVLSDCPMENNKGINGYTCSLGEYKIEILGPADNEWDPKPEEKDACLCS